MVRLALVLLLGRSRVLRVFLAAALGPLVAGACIWVFRTVQVEAIGPDADSLAVQTPVKAHLRDGSTILYRAGVLLFRDTLRGRGVRYGLTLRDSTERPITITLGTNVLLGLEPQRIGELPELVEQVRGRHLRIPPGWDGHAAERIVGVLSRADAVPARRT